MAHVACPACGHLSADPDFCDRCGAALADGARVAWLRVGDRLQLRLLPIDLEIAPPATQVATERATPVASYDTITDENPFALVEISIDSPLGQTAHRHSFRAVASDGRVFRVDQFASARHDDPDAAALFPDRLDVPVGLTSHAGTAVRVHRHVERPTLADLRKQHEGPPDPNQLADWMLPLCDAVSLLHEGGHALLRIAPRTVQPRPEGPFFVGLSGVYDLRRPVRHLTALAGYTAPELYAAAEPAPPTVACDIYSLGAVLYFLVSRLDPPVGALTGWASGLRVRDSVPTLPPGLGPVLERALSLDPEARYPTVEGFRDALVRGLQQMQRRTGAPSSLHIATGAETHIGIVKRLANGDNQDAVFAASTADGRTAMLAVIDGVSTARYGRGDIAAQLTRDEVERSWFGMQRGDTPDLDDRARLVQILSHANDAIIEEVNRSCGPVGEHHADVMGATCVLALIREGRVTIASLGDSSALLADGLGIECITRRHNLATLSMVDGVPPDVALSQADADALTRCLGAFHPQADGYLQPELPEVDILQFSLLPDDRLVLCTDGLTDYIAPQSDSPLAAIEDILADAAPPELAALELVTAANRGGGGDNVGVVVAALTRSPLSLAAWADRQRNGGAP